MTTMTITADFDGRGKKQHTAYAMPSLDRGDMWVSLTDVPCPVDGCTGTILWDEAGHAPGYRTCSQCERHFQARGRASAPELVLL